MILYRICLELFGRTSETAFSGQGGIIGSGRWHNPGLPIVYTSEHLSLAALEILANLQTHQNLCSFVYWKIDVPDQHCIHANRLPSDWKNLPSQTRSYGDHWLRKKQSVALRVPSALIDNEYNYFLNPLHPEFKLQWVIGKKPSRFYFDPRLVRETILP